MKLHDYAQQQHLLVKEVVANSQPDLISIGQVITRIRKVLLDLKVFVNLYHFKDEQEEIYFFKEVKPLFLSAYYHHQELFEILLFDSFRDVKSRMDNYDRVLLRMETFATRNKDFYEYCISGETYLDAHYFKKTIHNRHLSVNTDENFSSYYDEKLGRILAHESIRQVILNSLKKLKSGWEVEAGSKLQWTVSKVSLIELIYALHSCGVFNFGKSDIKQVVNTFEVAFGMDLGNYSKVFAEIRMRKNGQTIFLDQLRERFSGLLTDFK